MNKAELVDAIAVAADISKTKANDMLNALVTTVTAALQNGEEVNLVGFGTFTTAVRAARSGRNPKTGETIQIEASITPKFKPGKILKQAVANQVQ